MSLVFWTPLNNNLDNLGGIQGNYPSGSPGFGAGKVTPKCLESGGWIQYSNNAPIIATGSGNYCFCAWLKNKNTSVSTNDWVFVMGSGSGRCKGIWTGTGYKTTLEIAYQDSGQNIDTSINIQDGQWHHVLYNIKNNSTCTLWVDGKEQGTITLNSTGQNTCNASMVRLNSTYYAINDYRIYSHALSNKEIKEIASGLCLHYKFNLEDFYTPLPYIQSTGSQYIDTGITSGQNITRIEAQHYQTVNSAQQIMFGMYTGSGSGYSYFNYRESGSTYTCAWYGTVVDSGVAMSAGQTVTSTLTTSGSSFTYTVNGTSVSGTRAGSPSGSTHFYLFADNSNGSTIYQYKCNLCYFKIWVDNTLVRDFIPCMKNGNSYTSYGLYDRVNGVFYSSAGGSFTSPITYASTNFYDRRQYISLSSSQSAYFKITTAANKRFEIDMKWNSNSSRQLMGIHGTQDEYWGNNNGTWEKIGNSQGVGINERCVVCYDVGLLHPGQTTTWIKGSSTQYVGSCSDFNTYSQSTLEIGRLTNTSSYYCNMTVYGIKVFNGTNTLIMNLIPAGSGFYDTIGKSMYNSQQGNVGYDSVNNVLIPDCSGFGNDGSIVSASASTDTNIGTHSGYFEGNKYIEFASPWGNNTINQVTFSFWCKLASSTGYQFIFGAKNNPTSGAGWISLNTEGVKQWFYTGQYTNGVSGTINNNEWHMHTLTFNKGTGRWYLDGVFQKQTDISSSRTALSAASTFTIGDSYTGSSWSGTPFNGRISDFRIYTTVLSDSDVADLYNAKESIDNYGNLYDNYTSEKNSYKGFTIDKPAFRNSSIVDCPSLTEQLILTNYNVQNGDSSTWIPISVHYIPEGVFATSGSFNTFKYENENRWTNFGAINSATRPESGYWEFLVIHQANITGAFEYYRWKQNKNPFNATWADVEPSKVGTNVTRIAQSTTSSYGGMYWFNQSNCKMCFANSSNGNWFGCGIGQLWGTDSSGYGYIPSYNGVGVRGFQVVYMRVSPDTHKANIHSGLIEPTEIKELL